jgi:hypothetical protein
MSTIPIRDFIDFKEKVLNDPKLQEELKNDPVETLKKMDQRAEIPPDKWIYRIVVSTLGFTILIIIGAVIFIIGKSDGQNIDSHIPTILTALGSAAIGALAGLLSPSPRQ